jgi:hypothetical protein
MTFVNILLAKVEGKINLFSYIFVSHTCSAKPHPSYIPNDNAFDLVLNVGTLSVDK